MPPVSTQGNKLPKRCGACPAARRLGSDSADVIIKLCKGFLASSNKDERKSWRLRLVF